MTGVHSSADQYQWLVNSLGVAAQGGKEWEELLGGDTSPGKRWRLIYTVGTTGQQLAFHVLAYRAVVLQFHPDIKPSRRGAIAASTFAS